MSETQEKTLEKEKASENKVEQPKQEPIPKWLQDMLKSLSQNPEAAGVVASLGAIIAGGIMLLDDYKDFGEPVCQGCKVIPNAPHPHHWLLGALTLIGGVAGACTSGIAMLKKTPPPKVKVEKGLPPSLLEGAPPEVLEKYK